MHKTAFLKDRKNGFQIGSILKQKFFLVLHQSPQR